ncbi:MAG TPA: ECF-type sigma factor [Thermoanaerobaculia bacterium]
MSTLTPAPGAVTELLEAARRGDGEARRKLFAEVYGQLRKIAVSRLRGERAADDLERHRGGLPVKARPDSFLYRAGKLLRRRRLEAAALTVVLVSLAWAAVASRMSLARARHGESVAWQAHADAVYVTHYLATVLERAASGGLDSEADVLAILEDAEARIAGELADSPEAEARLRYAVARAFLGLGRPDDAERHARRALELSRSTVGLGRRDVERTSSCSTRSGDAKSEQPWQTSASRRGGKVKPQNRYQRRRRSAASLHSSIEAHLALR